MTDVNNRLDKDVITSLSMLFKGSSPEDIQTTFADRANALNTFSRKFEKRPQKGAFMLACLVLGSQKIAQNYASKSAEQCQQAQKMLAQDLMFLENLEDHHEDLVGELQSDVSGLDHEFKEKVDDNKIIGKFLTKQLLKVTGKKQDKPDLARNTDELSKMTQIVADMSSMSTSTLEYNLSLGDLYENAKQEHRDLRHQDAIRPSFGSVAASQDSSSSVGSPQDSSPKSPRP